ncbi:MAG: GDP-mannose 4,6-dehydratase [Planctomycetes bacterium]|nr:GDP-mannose 4,6-dehydratase [Planctomycetota bacterium]
MSILVTGGAGFIGSHLVDRLAARGESVLCLDNFDDFYSPAVKRENISGALRTGRVELVEGDICDAALCDALLARDDVRAVAHLAARAGVRPSIEDPALYERVNCQGTINLLEAARKRRARLEKFIFGSSSSVYGVSDRIPFSEDDPVSEPISPYAATKRAGELFCHVYHHLYGLPIVCLRFFTVYGPRQRPDLAIHKFARLIEAGEPVPMYGDGASRRDYTYCDDIVDGITAALERPFEFEIINLGSAAPVGLRDLIGLLEEAMGRQAAIERVPEQPGDVPVTYADISRARRLLDYSPSFPIRQGLAKFVEWFRANA